MEPGVRRDACGADRCDRDREGHRRASRYGLDAVPLRRLIAGRRVAAPAAHPRLWAAWMAPATGRPAPMENGPAMRLPRHRPGTIGPRINDAWASRLRRLARRARNRLRRSRKPLVVRMGGR